MFLSQENVRNRQNKRITETCDSNSSSWLPSLIKLFYVVDCTSFTNPRLDPTKLPVYNRNVVNEYVDMDFHQTLQDVCQH